MSGAQPSSNEESQSSFDEKVGQEINNIFYVVIEHMEEDIVKVRSSTIDDAERRLDEAINNCVQEFQTKREDFKGSILGRRPDSSSPTFPQEKENYVTLVDTVAKSIEKSKTLFDTIFKRIRDIVSTVLECIKAGVEDIWSQLKIAFNSIRNILTY